MAIEINEDLKRNNKFTTFLGKFYLRLTGWKIIGNIPDVKKLIVIVGPHTSNWDFVIAAFVSIAVDVKASFLGKHTLFNIPLIKYVMNWLGGIPVERSTRHGFVKQLVEVFKEKKSLLLALSPEGTRKKVEKWKTGFYHIAKEAEVPIIPMVIDYGKKAVCFSESLIPSGNIEKDFNYFLKIFSNCKPKKPDNFNYKTVI